MAEFDIKTEQWMSQSAFEALDKSTIPEGTEINIVGDIAETDLSIDLQNKINAGGSGRYWKLTHDGAGAWGTITCYINTTANSIEELANDIIIRSVIIGTFYVSAELWGQESYGQHIFLIKSAIASADTITITANSDMIYVMGAQVFHHLGFNDSTATFQVEKIY